MKKVLLASTALVFAGGMAIADVETSGSGRMGIIDPLDALDGSADTDVTFTSRIRISFSASGETDGGLSFGGSIRADNAAGGNAGTAGSVFAEGGFGRISMGDVDGAAKAAVGHVSGVGLTGLGDVNEIVYVANVGPETPGVLYENSFGDLTFYLSADRPNVSDDEAYAVGVSYGMGNYTFSAGYETTDNATVEIAGETIATGVDANHLVAGLTAGFGDATAKVVYGTGDADNDTVDIDQWAVSVDYVMGATTVTGFYRVSSFNDTDVTGYGVGAAYDLGGGASLKGGYANVDIDGIGDSDTFDFGLNMSF